MRLKALLLACACGFGLLLGALLGGAQAHRPASGQSPLCSPGYVGGVVGGEHKCLHAGEFCAAGHESDYERYGFSCVSGRLQTSSAPEPTTTTTSASVPPPPKTGAYQPRLRTKTAHCRARGPLPDTACTPGAVFSAATAADVCVPGYSASVRNVTTRVKNAVYAEYGIRSHRRGQYEVDHLISLELGGSNAISNLWPEAAAPRPGFHQKDVVENELHDDVCSGQLTLAAAQAAISTNWVAESAATHTP